MLANKNFYNLINLKFMKFKQNLFRYIYIFIKRNSLPHSYFNSNPIMHDSITIIPLLTFKHHHQQQQLVPFKISTLYRDIQILK